MTFGLLRNLVAFICALMPVFVSAATPTDKVSLGLGSYYTVLKSSSDPAPPATLYLSDEALGKAVPTNQWYSSVVFEPWSRVIHAHPMTYRATQQGFEVDMPSRNVATNNGSRDVIYPHSAAIVVSPIGFKHKDARLAGFSDWMATISMASDLNHQLKVSVLHGSPFSYYECTNGDVNFKLSDVPQVLASPTLISNDVRVAAFTIAGHSYAIFAPTGSTWDWSDPNNLKLSLPEHSRYFSIAGLPDNTLPTLQQFLAVAYAFPTNTKVEWKYDPQSSKVNSLYTVETIAKEGTNLATFMGLYPHHWANLSSTYAPKHTYDSIRGEIKLITSNQFSLDQTYNGFVPWWGALNSQAYSSKVKSVLVGDLAKSGQLFTKMGRGTYSIGKGLGAVAQLMSVAEAEGQLETRDELLLLLKKRMESWFDGSRNTYFVEDQKLGSFIGLPQEYNSVSDMNDHHFHYGYWIMGAAHIALRDPAWASPQQWGGMVNKLIADIATDERGRSDYPFLRNFDVYEGHSWASGTAIPFDDGNNQESSSEAINAWAGLILWAEATGNNRLRDLGIYLYTSEIASTQQYWFDPNHQIFPSDYGKPLAAQVFGGKYSYNTWWTQEPRQITGINLLPITTASTYLGQYPEYVKNVVTGLPVEVKAYSARGMSDGTPKDIWQDIIASYLALSDPESALSLWDSRGTIEFGETRSHTMHFIYSLNEMGVPDPSVTANTAFYAVFKNHVGKRTYLAYNASRAKLVVRFSNGISLEVEPRNFSVLEI